MKTDTPTARARAKQQTQVPAPLPTFGWGQVPTDLLTRAQLAKVGLNPGGPARGKLVWRRGKREAHLFALREAQAKRVVSEAQRQVLARGRATQAARQRAEEEYWLVERQRAEEEYWLVEQAEEKARRQRDRDRAIRWARRRLELGRALILDSETTDLEGAYLVQVGVLNLTGEVLLDTLVNPGVPIAAGATAVHGLRDDDVQAAPPFCEVLPHLTRLLYRRHVVVYNASFDKEILRRELLRHHRAQLAADRRGYDDPAARAADAWIEQVTWHCAMERYAAYFGEWSSHWGDYRYQPLAGGDHTAIGDCRAALALLQNMAAAPLAGEAADLQLVMEPPPLVQPGAR